MTMSLEELKGLKVDQQIDARGTACPGPLLAAKRAITSVPVQGVMEVLSTDEGTTKDIPRWAAKMKHDLLGMYDESGCWHLYLRRGR